MGNNKPEKLENFVKIIEKISNKEAKIKHLGTQPGDVLITNANISLAKDFGYNPKTNLKEGLKHFHDWFRVTKTLREKLSNTKTNWKEISVDILSLYKFLIQREN